MNETQVLPVGGNVGLEPEQLVRGKIDKLINAAGWAVQSFKKANISAAHWAAICIC